MICVNLYGAPSAGKSTMASYLFYELKKLGENCELVTEVAKDLCWQEDKIGLRNQVYVAGNQLLRLDRLKDKVDIAITDAPIMAQTIYYKLNNCPSPELFEQLMFNHFDTYDNINIFLKVKEIKKDGRIWLDKIDDIESQFKNLFNKYNIDYYELDYEHPKDALEIILKVLHYNKHFK